MEYHGPNRVSESVKPGMILLSDDFRFAKRVRENGKSLLVVDPFNRDSDAFSERRGRKLFLVESVSYIDVKGQLIEKWTRFGDKAIATARLIRKDTRQLGKARLRIPMACLNTSGVMDALEVGKGNLETGEINLWNCWSRYWERPGRQ